MALKTVTGKITRPDGVVGPVSLRIVLSAPAVIAGSQEIVPAAIDVTPAPDGTWSLQLQANLDLSPATTSYTALETIGGVTAPLIFVVPQSAGPFKLADILAAAPAPSPPAALDSQVVHLANPETITGDKTFAGSMIEGKDFRRSSQSVTEAVLVSGVDATAGELVDVTLTANRVVGLPLNPAVGQELVLLVTMGGAGGYKLTWPAGIKTAWQPASAVGDVSALRLRYFGTNWQQIGGQVAVSQLGVLAHRGPAVFGSVTVRDPNSSSPYTNTARPGNVSGILGVAGDQVALGTAYTPSQLTFKMVSSGRAVEPWSPDFMMIDEGMWNITKTDARFQQTTDAGGGTYSGTDGYSQYLAGAGGWTVSLAPKVKTMAPYMVVKARITQLNGSVRVGIRASASDATNQIYLEYTGATFNIVRTISGATTSVSAQGQPTTMPAAPFTLMFVLGWPEAWGYIQYDNGSIHALGFMSLSAVLDLRNISEWGARWIPYVGFVVTANQASRISNFGVGYPGAIGLRDMALVTYTDGTPYTRDGKYFMCVTIPWGGGDYRGQHQGVFSFDPWTYRFKQVSHFFHEVGSQWTSLFGSGCLMFDDAADQWILITGGWGLGDNNNTGIDQYMVTSTRDLLQGVHRLKPTKMTLPTNAATHSMFDGVARLDSNGVWQFVYTESNARTGWTSRYPVLASGTSLTSLSRVADDSAGSGAQDGNRWFQLGGVWYIATGRDGTKNPRVYAFSTFPASPVDPTWSSDDTAVSSGMLGSVASNHWQLIPVTDEAETRYLLTCYDSSLIFIGGSQSKSLGGVVVWLADQTANGTSDSGHEFPRRRSRRA